MKIYVQIQGNYCNLYDFLQLEQLSYESNIRA